MIVSLGVLGGAALEVEGRITAGDLRASRRHLLSIHSEGGNSRDKTSCSGQSSPGAQSRRLRVFRIALEVIWPGGPAESPSHTSSRNLKCSSSMRDNWAFEMVPERQFCTVVQTVFREMRSSAWEDSHRKSFRDTARLDRGPRSRDLGKSRLRDFFPKDGGRLSGSSSAFRPVKSQPAQALSRSSPCW